MTSDLDLYGDTSCDDDRCTHARDDHANLEGCCLVSQCECMTFQAPT